MISDTLTLIVYCKLAQSVEQRLDKPLVIGSNPVLTTKFLINSEIAQLVERCPEKACVEGSTTSLGASLVVQNVP